MSIDTKPIYPRPSDDSVLAAIKHLFNVVEYIAPGMLAKDSLLVRAMVARGSTVAAAEWAIHELCQVGALTAIDFRKGSSGRRFVTEHDTPAGLEVARGRLHINGPTKSEWGNIAVIIDHEQLRAFRESLGDTKKVTAARWPDNPDVRDLCNLLQKRKPGESLNSIALKFTRGDSDKAQSLLRQARRYSHLWRSDN